MIFRFILHNGTRHVREFLDTTVYHRHNVLFSGTVSPTSDIEYAEYFLRSVHDTYTSLAALMSTYTTTPEDTALLRELQEQYTPEVLI